MQNRFRFGAIALAGALGVGLLAGCGSSSGGGTAGATSTTKVDFVDETGKAAVVVKAVDNLFTPQNVKVSTGTTVTFDNAGRNDHNLIAVTGGSFKNVETNGFAPGAKVPVKFDKPGEYGFYCSLHGTPTHAMEGRVLVVP